MTKNPDNTNTANTAAETAAPHVVTFADIKKNAAINTYITSADSALKGMGYTEHSYAHVMRTATLASEILRKLGYSEREVELARIAGYMHDIGNVINRVGHSHSGAVMAFQLLTNMGMDPLEIAQIVNAIGNHDEDTAFPVSPISASLILADKSDVRRTRVRNRNQDRFDIHDRVNYAVRRARLTLAEDLQSISLGISIDQNICAVMDYFEIFLGRMLLCRRAADYLGIEFRLVINGNRIL